MSLPLASGYLKIAPTNTDYTASPDFKEIQYIGVYSNIEKTAMQLTVAGSKAICPETNEIVRILTPIEDCEVFIGNPLFGQDISASEYRVLPWDYFKLLQDSYVADLKSTKSTNNATNLQMPTWGVNCKYKGYLTRNLSLVTPYLARKIGVQSLYNEGYSHNITSIFKCVDGYVWTPERVLRGGLYGNTTGSVKYSTADELFVKPPYSNDQINTCIWAQEGVIQYPISVEEACMAHLEVGVHQVIHMLGNDGGANSYVESDILAVLDSIPSIARSNCSVLFPSLFTGEDFNTNPVYLKCTELGVGIYIYEHLGFSQLDTVDRKYWLSLPMVKGLVVKFSEYDLDAAKIELEQLTRKYPNKQYVAILGVPNPPFAEAARASVYMEPYLATPTLEGLGFTARSHYTWYFTV